MIARPPLAEALELEPHPEGGWFRQTWKTDVTVRPPGYAGPRATATAIYYLLTTGESSAWHRVTSDEVWLHHRGVPLLLRLGGSEDRPADATTEIVLGPDVAAGQQPQAVVPAGHWQSAHPLTAGDVLVSCVVSPGFEFADWEELPGAERVASENPPEPGGS